MWHLKYYYYIFNNANKILIKRNDTILTLLMEEVTNPYQFI